MMRGSYVCLNGLWKYAINRSSKIPQHWDGEIVVPYVPECKLSGVGRVLKPDEYLWYNKSVNIQRGALSDRVILHFGAVDQCCVVYVNGNEAAKHDGGYTSFSADITQHINSGCFDITVMVIDETDTAPYARGAQKLEHGGKWHTPMSGIWQTVWLECVPENHIDKLEIIPHYDEKQVEFDIKSTKKGSGGTIEIYAGANMVTCAEFISGEKVVVDLPGALSWSPGNPFLYRVKITLEKDIVASYFGMRKISAGKDNNGNYVMMLNNRPYFITGVIDDGMYPETLYTPPNDKAMVKDILHAKQCGFNGIRKTGKIEPMRWYYHCDRLGMLVWQDLPGGGGGLINGISDVLSFSSKRRNDSAYLRFGRSSVEGRKSFVRDMERLAKMLKNSPSLVVWSLFDEGYGQFDASQLYRKMNSIDSSRLVDHASGWYDQGEGDFCSIHSNGKPPVITGADAERRVIALTSVGDIGYSGSDNLKLKSPYASVVVETGTNYRDRIKDLYTQQIPFAISKGLGAVFFKQLTDSEDEISGLVSYDRKMVKIKPEILKEYNENLMGIFDGYICDTR